MKFLWHLLALILSSQRVADWLIKRAQRTPYINIPSRDGKQTYMERWWLFNPYGKDATGEDTPARIPWLPSVRIHHICLPDEDRDLHDRPWNARTVILRGFYVEEREGSKRGLVRMPSYTGRLLYGQYHRIAHVSDGGVWTLFITGRKRGMWGFKVEGKKVPWRTYLGLQTASIQRGRALVLVGPQGSGKTKKAHELAAQTGRYIEMSVNEISSPFQLGNALASEPATVIVELDRPLDERLTTTLKGLITNTHTVCHRKMREPISVRTPNFIFCTGNRNFLPDDGGRRFHIVELPAPHPHHPV
jgi:hypothetical protein